MHLERPDPPKIRIFLWQAFRGRLPSADQIRKRNGPGSQFCALCGDVEDSDHIFFHCHLAKLIWSCVRDWLNVSWAPASFAELRVLTHDLSGVSRRLFWVGLGALCWSLWTTRNKFTIKHVFPAKPADCLFQSCALLQQWKSLTKDDDHEAFTALTSKIRTTASLLCRQA